MLPELRGAFSLVFMDEHTLYAARDRQGIRPLVLGRLERGWVVASETAALDIVGASVIREVEPGELIAIDADGLRRSGSPTAEPKGCVFEYVYLARPGHHHRRPRRARGPGRDGPPAGPRAPGRGRPGHPDPGVRHAGRDRLRPGVRHPVRPGPGQELLRRPDLHRAAARPSASSASGSSSTRCATVIRGKRLVVVDDSIVRGNTQRALVRMLREAGAAEVHVRISSPPVTWPCFYGIDFASRAELIATGLSVEEVRASIGADSLGYLCRTGMVAATERPRTSCARPASRGSTRSPLPDVDRLGKHVLEGARPGASPAARPSGRRIDRDTTLAASATAADALSRP